MTDSNIMLISDAVNFANKAQVTVVAARGNTGYSNKAYPATLDDDWILCVGGTGINGEYAQSLGMVASTGQEIDVSAPCSDFIVLTIQAYGSYTTKIGTSYSAPHVTGVGALLMSYLNNDSLKLAPEDVEQILERTAVDTDHLGPDTLTGWGRLNAKQALRYVEKPANSLHHFRSTSNNSSLQLSLVDTAFRINLKEHVADHNNQWYAAGDYLVDVYRIDASNTHVIPTSDTLKSFWPRSSSSNTLQALESNTLIPHHKAYLDSVNKEKAWVYGYVYKLYDTSYNFLGWLPNDTTLNHYNLDYSVLSLDSAYQAPSGVEERHEPKFSVSLYPNPGTDAVSLEIETKEAGTANISLLNVIGQTLYQISQRTEPNDNYTIPIVTNEFQPGLYFIRVELNQQTITKELIILKL